MTEPAEATPADGSDPQDRSLVDDVHLLASDAKAYAEAELAWQRARGSFAGRQVAAIAALGVTVGSLVFFALMALVMGSLLAIAPQLTPVVATALVCGTLLLIALLLTLVARALWKRMIRALASGDSRASRDGTA